MKKQTKTVVLPVKYRKNQRFYKEKIKSIEESRDMFSERKETLIITDSNVEYYIDLPYEVVLLRVKGE